MVTAERLRELLDYDPDSGIFTWRIARTRAKAGTAAGCVATKRDGRRYLIIRISQKNYYAHRLAFLWLTGAFPKFVVDHKNGNGLNNSWGNLRPATDRENLYNARRKAGKTGYRGVWPSADKKRFVAVFSRKTGDREHLGTFDTAEEAAKAWDSEAGKEREDFALLNFPC